MSFNDKVAIVVGGGQGIGAGIAVALAAEGAQVAVWDINDIGAKATVEKIEANNGKASALKIDALDYAQVKAGVDDVVNKFGQLDIMICTVGGGKFMPFADVTAELFQQQVGFNLYPVFNCAHAALAPMLEKNYGKMLFFISATGGTANLVGYEAGKAGVVSMIQTLVAELEGKKINVNAINPNVTDTPLTRNAFKEFGGGDDLFDMYTADMLYGINTPEYVAKLALFLISEDADRLTGQFIQCS